MGRFTHPPPTARPRTGTAAPGTGTGTRTGPAGAVALGRPLLAPPGTADTLCSQRGGNHTPLFIYLWVLFVCFFPSWKWTEALSSVPLIGPFAGGRNPLPRTVSSVLGKHWRLEGASPPPQRGTLCFLPNPSLFQKCELLRMLSRNTINCALHKKGQ